jgi:hypothetical protein
MESEEAAGVTMATEYWEVSHGRTAHGWGSLPESSRFIVLELGPMTCDSCIALRDQDLGSPVCARTFPAHVRCNLVSLNFDFQMTSESFSFIKRKLPSTQETHGASISTRTGKFSEKNSSRRKDCSLPFYQICYFILNAAVLKR